MPNSSNHKNACFFTPHPLSKHHPRHSQSKPTQQPKPATSNQHQHTKTPTTLQKFNQPHKTNNNNNNNKTIRKRPPPSDPHPIQPQRRKISSEPPNPPKPPPATIHHINSNTPQPESDRHESSSLSSLHSEDDHQASSPSSSSSSASSSSSDHHHHNNNTDQPTRSNTENQIIPDHQPIPHPVSSPKKLIQQDHPPQSSPHSISNKIEIDDLDDQPSELGEDVCLEYTDFGQDLGFPVTWSESEYDEDHEAEEPADEFAEFLLMDASEGDHSFGFEQLQNFRASSKYSQMMAGIDRSEGGSTDEESHLGYMIIEELGDEDEDDDDDDNDNEDDRSEKDDRTNNHSQSISGDDGATTDSLDEDDHSGLVRFGIEADDGNEGHSDDDDHQADEEDDASFYDLPATSALGSMLTNFDLSVISTPDSTNPGEPRTNKLSGSREIKLPVMGSFSVDRQDGTNAGRTIIDEEKSVPLSPFTGTKVIRYNRFRKLRQQSCTGESEPSSLVGTPKAEESQDSIHPGPSSTNELGLPEQEFDITAFIRGISSIDEGCSDGEKNAYEGTTAELDGLSRWQRVPMTAFRRQMMRSCAEGGSEMLLDGAIQPSSSLDETLGLSVQPGRVRKKNGSSSSSGLHLSGLSAPNKVYDRRLHRRMRKSTSSYNSHGKQSKLDPCPSDPLRLDSEVAKIGLPGPNIDHHHHTLAGPSKKLDSLVDDSSDGFHSRLLFDELLDLDQGDLSNQACPTTTTTTISTTSTINNTATTTSAAATVNPVQSHQIPASDLLLLPSLDHSLSLDPLTATTTTTTAPNHPVLDLDHLPLLNFIDKI
ncbi:hypothetical protein PGT21_012582 [Puccinia graminis f. sp. tritici]|uniref:Uncharacterized protein n=1 Tax=Puccinia graminis f. sp. tritici TaxID=56615 RepID=A0A5B0N3W7_PUCGR|nr:hypothetical protein PGTUg99_013905 [Puccinia graminis f. sp. tritici]KAA1083957.1 hypothetical protein PGT21_012582 [Puccinia graminis f. sp. tritici]